MEENQMWQGLYCLVISIRQRAREKEEKEDTLKPGSQCCVSDF